MVYLIPMAKKSKRTINQEALDVARQARHNAYVADMAEGRRQRAIKIPSGKVYRRKGKYGKDAE